MFCNRGACFLQTPTRVHVIPYKYTESTANDKEPNLIFCLYYPFQPCAKGYFTSVRYKTYHYTANTTLLSANAKSNFGYVF